MRRHFVSGFARGLLSLSQEKSSGVETVGLYVESFQVRILTTENFLLVGKRYLRPMHIICVLAQLYVICVIVCYL